MAKRVFLSQQSGSDDVTRLNDAIDSVDAGGIVFVDEDLTLYETIPINKVIGLHGFGGGTTDHNTAGTTITWTGDKSSGQMLRVENVVAVSIRGLRLVGQATSGSQLKGLYTRFAPKMRLDDIVFQDWGWSALLDESCYSALITNCGVKNFEQVGIELRSKNHNTRIYNCHFSGSGGYSAIRVGHNVRSSLVLIQGCHFELDSVSRAVHIRDVRMIDLLRNYFRSHSSQQAFIKVEGGSEPAKSIQVTGNYFDDTGNDTYVIQTAGLGVENGFYGINHEVSVKGRFNSGSGSWIIWNDCV